MKNNVWLKLNRHLRCDVSTITSALEVLRPNIVHLIGWLAGWGWGSPVSPAGVMMVLCGAFVTEEAYECEIPVSNLRTFVPRSERAETVWKPPQ